jgi:hypothetical protein
MFEVEAQERRAAAALKGNKNRHPPVRNEPSLSGKQDESKRSAAQAAKAAKAGVVATKAMAAVKQKAPEVFDLAKAGKVNVSEAKKAAALPEVVRSELVEQVRNGKSVRQILDAFENQDQVVALISSAANSVAKKATALFNACRDLELLLRKHGGSVTGAGAGQIMAVTNRSRSLIDQCLAVIEGKAEEVVHAS